MKLLLINNYLQKLDVLRANPLRNAYELSELKSEISNMIDGYVLKHKKEDVFTDILNHIYLDVEDSLYEAFELSRGF
jgi:uncharacterized protein YdeI (BOF family)